MKRIIIAILGRILAVTADDEQSSKIKAKYVALLILACCGSALGQNDGIATDLTATCTPASHWFEATKEHPVCSSTGFKLEDSSPLYTGLEAPNATRAWSLLKQATPPFSDALNVKDQVTPATNVCYGYSTKNTDGRDFRLVCLQVPEVYSEAYWSLYIEPETLHAIPSWSLVQEDSTPIGTCDGVVSIEGDTHKLKCEGHFTPPSDACTITTRAGHITIRNCFIDGESYVSRGSISIGAGDQIITVSSGKL